MLDNTEFKNRKELAVSEEVEYTDEIESELYILENIGYALPIANAVAGSYLIETFRDLNASFIKDSNESFKSFVSKTNEYASIMRETDLELGWNSMGSISSMTSIKMGKNGTATIFVPVTKNFRIGRPGPISFTSPWIQPDYSTRDENNLVFLKKMEALFGKDFWDIDKGVFHTIPVTPNSLDKPGITKDMIDEETDFVDTMLNRIRSVRIVSPAAGATQARRKVRNLKDAEAENNGETKTFRMDVCNVREFLLFVELDLKPETVKYVTQSQVPTVETLHMYLTDAVKAAATGETFPYTYMPMKNIRRQNKGKRQFSRINDLGLCIDDAGSPMYVPTADNIDSFDKTYKDTGSEDKELGWTLASPFKPIMSAEENPTNFVNNKIIYYDAVNSKLTFTQNNTIKVRDLEKCIPVEAQHAYSFLNGYVGSGAVRRSLVAFNYNMSRFEEQINKISIDLNDFKALIDPKNGGLLYEFGNYYWNGDVNDERFKTVIRNLIAESATGYVDEVTRALNYINSRLNAYAEMDDDFDIDEDRKWAWTYTPTDVQLRHIAGDSEIKFLRPLGKAMLAVSKVMIADPVTFIEGRGVGQGMIAVGLAFTLDKYLPNYAQLETATKEYQDSFAKVPLSPDWKAPALPGIKQGFKLLPHQGGVFQQTAKQPKFAILAVDAGGGKTLIALSKIIQMMKEGLIKKPLIECPHYLIGNYVEDNNTLTEGRYNIIPINRSTIERHGKEKILEMVKAAPPNTICITDYLFVKGGTYEASYGTTTVTVSENSEFLREMAFDAVFVDESHFLKNAGSQTTIASYKLLSTIPRRYLMSGTIVDGSPKDVQSQANLLDPTIFGSEEEFLDEYAAAHRGGKVTVWKEGAQKKMRDKIGERIAYIQVKKKAWAALLPDRQENFHEAQLTKNQRQVYTAILESVLDEIRSNAELMAKLKSAQEDDDESVNLEALLNPYLARLEQFLTAPGTDDFGQKLDGDDLISPKVKIAAKLCKEHLDRGMKGKILIFTSYVRSAEAIYNNLPPAIKAKTLLYKAAKKSEHKAIFQNDDNIQIMVGVEQSLNTGHNFQYVSRIIRMESVWNPGTLEQAESRIFRPDVKNKFGIDAKVLDWVIASGTIDVTKAARLMSKVLSKVAFDERDNPIYDNLPQVSLVPMTLDAISSHNDFEEDLSEHIEAYRAYREAVKVDFDIYRKDPRSLKTPFVIPTEDVPASFAYIIDAPYIENHSLPFQEEMGLQSVTEYASDNMSSFEDIDLNGKWVHTEFGDGKVVKTTKNTIHVNIKGTNQKVIVDKLKSFVFIDQEKAQTRKKSVKDEIVSRIQMRAINSQLESKPEGTVNKTPKNIDVPKNSDEKIVKEKQVEEKKVSKPRKPVPNTDFEANGSFNLYALAVNNQIAVGVDNEDPDVPADDIMADAGFKFSGSYAYAEIRSKLAMNNLYDFVMSNIEKGNIVLPAPLLADLEKVKTAFDTSKSRAKMIDAISVEELRTFHIMRRRKPKDQKTVNLFFVIEDDVLYAYVDLEMARRGNVFIKRKIKGITWEVADGEWFAFFKTRNEAAAFAKDLASKYSVANLRDFRANLKSLTIRKVKEK